MTSSSMREYGKAIRRHCISASKKEKGELLTEFCTVTKYHRKAAVRLLCHTPSKTPPRGRETVRPTGKPCPTKPWETSDHLCSKRLAPFMLELVDFLERHGGLSLGPEVKEDVPPGSLRADLPFPYGSGVATGWHVCVPVWGKGKERVGGGVHQVRSPSALSTA